MRWPHCFKKHQTQGFEDMQAAGAQEAHQQQHQTQDQDSASPSWPQSRRPSPSEQDRRSAEALKKEGNTYFGKTKYGAAIEVLAQLCDRPGGKLTQENCLISLTVANIGLCRSTLRHLLCVLTGQVWLLLHTLGCA